VKEIRTDRLTIRWFDLGDAPFILRLINEPAWLEHIGDKGVNSVQAAEDYLTTGPIAMYARYGFGLNLVLLTESQEPIGMCGLLKRDSLEDVDLGFAYLEEFWGQGFGKESVEAMMCYSRKAFHLERVVAITSPKNTRSERLLNRVGFYFDREIRLSSDSDQLNLWRREFENILPVNSESQTQS
jgi:[ribosomal protein S5]-alanine N-acetyltransferase